MSLTKTEFEDFRMREVPLIVRRGGTTGGSVSVTHGDVTSTRVEAFGVPHRKDIKSYKKFTGQLKLYFRMIWKWWSQVRVDGVERVFDQTTVVPDPTMEDHRLWMMQQA